MEKKLSSNIEDYLETITLLGREENIVRVKDISKKMKISKPSVHSALHILEDNGFIHHEHYGYVKLTEKGKIEGENIYNTHQILVKFLNEILNVDYRIAEKDACKIEHNISSQTLSKLVEFIKFVEINQERFAELRR